MSTVKKVQAPRKQKKKIKTLQDAVPSAPPSFSEKSFSDFHLYTLSEPVTLNDNSKKQVEFLSKVYEISVRKYHLISISSGGYSQPNLKAQNKIGITNSQANQLGVPLPKGTVRVFKTDQSDGSLEFKGQDSIDHTPKNQNITLNTGNAFDIIANKIATDRTSTGQRGYTTDINMTITNHKDISAEIVVEINNYQGDNTKFMWISKQIDVERVSASLLRIRRVFAPNESVSYLWTEQNRQ